MPDHGSAAGLKASFSAIRAKYPDVDTSMVEAVVRALLDSVGGDLSSREAKLLAEVEALGTTITNAKAEIAALGMDEITASHIPSATDELDEIVQHTAKATHTILEACEQLSGLGDTLSGAAQALVQRETTHIFEACNFQDITGQRIGKIVATLKTIEQRVALIAATIRGGAPPPPRPGGAAPDGPASLLNGPQMPAAAMSQSDIDQLLADFG
jgi:chemotaxis protein CheZ